jgi:heme exporter protein D
MSGCLVSYIMWLVLPFQEMLFRKQALQQAEKVSREFVLDHQSYDCAEALYSCISNSLKSLAEVQFCFYMQIKVWYASNMTLNPLLIKLKHTVT